MNPREIVLWVNSNDMVLGKLMVSDCHERHLMHRLGIVFLYNSLGRVFITKRHSEDHWMPGKTDATASFHVPADESWEDCVGRETFAQTGFRRTPEYIGHFAIDREPEHVYARVYRATFDGPVTQNPHLHEAGQFMLVDDIDQGLAKENRTPWLSSAWQTYKEKLRDESRTQQMKAFNEQFNQRYHYSPKKN
jgi:isopentenyldiphosphate isomerase